MIKLLYNATIISLSISLAVMSCGNSGRSVESTISGPRMLWAKHATSSYVIEQTRICFCVDAGYYVQVTVVNNEIVKGIHLEDSTLLVEEDFRPYKTVEELFGFIDEAVRKKPAVLRVTYDPIYGYPRSIFVDKNLDMADEEIGYKTILLQLGN